MIKKPYTTEDLFTEILLKLKKENLYPEMMDYSSADKSGTQILNAEWNPIGIVRFGSNEGIYLDIYGELYTADPAGNEKPITLNIGTFKTLSDDRDAFYRMSRLSADFVIETRAFMRNHPEDFNWSGFDLKAIHNGKCVRWMHAAKRERALELIKQFFKHTSYDYILLINNRTKEEEKLTFEVVAMKEEK